VSRVYAGIAGLALLAGPAAADGVSLAAGKAAGIQKAQDADSMTALYLIGGGAIIAGIVLLASDDDDTPATATTTTGT